MTNDAKPIEFGRNGERRVVCLCQQDPDGKWTAPVMATAEDLAAAGYQKAGTDEEYDAAISALESANARIAELEAERDSYRDQLRAWHESVSESNRAHLEEAAELLRQSLTEPSTLHGDRASKWYYADCRDQALRAKPSPTSEPVCRRCDDTHKMYGEDWGPLACTSCPTPCQKCRAGGNGAYCETPRCACDCHRAKPSPAGCSTCDGEGAIVDAGGSLLRVPCPDCVDARDAHPSVKPSPAGEKELHPWRSGDCVAHLTSGCSCRPCLLSRGVQEPAGEKDLPELCPVVGCGCDGCTYCHDNHDEQTRCNCQCEYYRSPPAPVEQPKPPGEAPLTSDDIELTTVFAVLSYWRDATALATASHDVWSQARRYLAAAGALLGDDWTREGYVALCDCALDLCAMGKLGPATLAPILGSEISRIDRRIDELERIAKGGAR